MSQDPVSRLLAEAAHLPPATDPELDALRWAVLVEHVLGITLTDEQITSGVGTRPADLRALVAASSDAS